MRRRCDRDSSIDTYVVLDRGTSKLLYLLVDRDPEAIARFESNCHKLQALDRPGAPKVAVV